MAINVQQLIDGLYIAFYNRAADNPGYLFWENVAGLSQPQALSTTISAGNYGTADMLGQQFFSSQQTYFNSQYAALSNSAFIDQVYTNFGGSVADVHGQAFWGAKLAGGESRQQVASEISNDFLSLNLAGDSELTAAELAQATVRQNTYLDKVTVSEYYASKSVGHSFMVAQNANDPNDLAFKAQVAIVQGITDAQSTVQAAEAEIDAVVAAGNLNPILNATPPGGGGGNVTTLADLTINSDTRTGTGNDVVNAPLVANNANVQTSSLNAGDNITLTGSNNQLNVIVGAADATVKGFTLSGVQTLSVQNTAPIASNFDATNITGLTTVTNLNSIAGSKVVVGSAGTPLAAAITTVNVTGTTANTSETDVFVAATALTGTTDALAVNLTNTGGSIATHALIKAGSATTTNGYETINVKATGTDFAGLGNPFAGANSTTSVVVTGAGAVTLFGDGVAPDFTKLATIDASAATGNVTITGNSLPITGGLLAGDTVIKSVLGGSGNDSVDVSSMTLAQLTANTTTVDLKGGTNTLIVDNTVATSTTAVTGLSNVQILGDANASGTVDFTKLPNSITTFQLDGAVGATALTLNNAASTFTFDMQNFPTSSALTTTINAAGTGTSDSFHMIVGSATAGIGTFPVGPIFAINGYEKVEVTAQGTAEGFGELIITPSAGGNAAVTIDGSVNLTIAAPVAGNAINFVGGTNTSITITDTGVVTLATTVNGGSTNAQTIDASTSGGLIMGGAELGNVGQQITGSSAHNNVLIGSVANDKLVGGSQTDTLATDGGGDTVQLGATHVLAHVEVFGINNNATTLTPGNAEGALIGSITDNTAAGHAGFWGIAAGGAPANIFALFNNHGTSADQAVVSNFTTGAAGDVVDLSVGSFGGQSGAYKGLTTVNGTTAAAVADVTSTSAASGTTLTGATVDFVKLTGATFANADALAVALNNGTFGLTLSAPLVVNNINHLLIGYDDASANAHIADVAIKATAATASLAGQTIAAQDLVELVGKTTASIDNHNLHLVA